VAKLRQCGSFVREFRRRDQGEADDSRLYISNIVEVIFLPEQEIIISAGYSGCFPKVMIALPSE
jgi:hypothetical protein